ncbi:unnamed protein product [Sphagnum tenellum]
MARQSHKNRSVSILTSPHAARKKCFTKLDITMLNVSRMDNITWTCAEREAEDNDQEPPFSGTTRTPGSIGQIAARNQLTYDSKATNFGLPQCQGLKGQLAQAERSQGLASLTSTPFKSSSSKNITLGRKTFIILPKELSFGKVVPFGTKESPWDAHKESAQARPS